MNTDDFTSFLNEKWLPSLLSLIGGALGAWSFVDNYILRFKPKLYIGSQVFFKLKNDDRSSRKEIEAILLSAEICNHRKKYGLVYDFAVKVYKSDEINPDNRLYYSSELASILQLNENEIETKDLKPFSPIAVLPNSNKSASIIAGKVAFSKMEVNSSANYCVEAYYKIKPQSKWVLASKLDLYNVTASESYISGKRNIDGNLLEFTQLNYDDETKLNNIRGSAVTSIYKGAFHRQKNMTTNKWKYNIFKPIEITMAFFKQGYIAFDIFQNNVVDKTFRLTAIKKYATKKPKLNIIIGNKELSPKTSLAIAELFTELEKIALETNALSEKNYHVTFRKNGVDDFTVSCYHMSLKVYKAGDTSIRVQEENSQFGSKVRYNFQLKQGLFKKQYWHLENDGYMSIKSFAIRIVDFLMLHFN